MNILRRLFPDTFVLALLLAIALAAVLPVQGRAAVWLGALANAAVVLLFFLHGLRLPGGTLLAALRHWRLHLLILTCTYLLFPALGLTLASLFPQLLSPALWAGVLYLCVLPSTVQSAIAFTSVARGNVGGAVASAAASNLLGVLITPLLVGLLLHQPGGAQPVLAGMGKVVLQLLLPFTVGHLLRRWLAGWAGRHRQIIGWADRSTIMLAVYSAFSSAVISGIWQQIPPDRLLWLLALCTGLLLVMLFLTGLASRALGLSREDEIAVVFCGTHKSLASGVPMSRVLFAGSEAGFALLPVMIFHQLQLMVSAWLAQRHARAEGDPAADRPGPS